MKVHFASARSPLAHSCVPTMIEILRNQQNPDAARRSGRPGRRRCGPLSGLPPPPRRLEAGRDRDERGGPSLPEKVAVYDERDTPWCRFPGIYVSMPASHFSRRWQVAGGYYTIHDPAARLDVDPAQIEQDLLCSFVGGRTHRCRDAVLRLGGPRIHVESPEGFVFYDPSSVRFDERRKSFAETLFRSKFALCPRGQGPRRSVSTRPWRRDGLRSSSRTSGFPRPVRSGTSSHFGGRRTGSANSLVSSPRSRARPRRWAAAHGSPTRSGSPPTSRSTAVLDQLEARRRAPGFTEFPAGGRHDAQYRLAGTANLRMHYHGFRGRVGRVLRGR